MKCGTTCLNCGKSVRKPRRTLCSINCSRVRHSFIAKKWDKKQNRLNRKKFLHLAKIRARKYRNKYPERIKETEIKKRLKNRLLVLKHYGGIIPKCACCKETIVSFLTIDHINGGGSKHINSVHGSQGLMRWLILNNYPEGYRILCYNCNCGRQKNCGICPHKKLKSEWAKRLQRSK